MNELTDKHHVIPHIGMRTIKSAIAVATSFAIWQLIRLIFKEFDIHPLFAYLSALLAMRDTYKDSITFGIKRIKGTVIASCIGIPSIALLNLIYSLIKNKLAIRFSEIIVICLGLILCLYISFLLKCHPFCAACAAVFLVIVIKHNDGNEYYYAMMRIIETSVGIVVGTVVNRFIAPLKKENKA